ncbi:MAG TPA: potassium-transporting ATPase subunit KdpA, partial [Tepidiformaceae bacterium]|nr:potassium-transporting ATPase subunit KdpA [Tepidiformaceae bacterium]
MTLAHIVQVVIYVAIIVASAKPLGTYLANLYEGRRTFLHPLLGRAEQRVYRVSGIDAEREQDWKQYAVALLGFNLVGFLLLYSLLRLQGWLPLNPEGLPGLKPGL